MANREPIPANKKQGEMEMYKKTTFPLITKGLQEAYEQGTKGSQDKTPDICGFYGRGCRQLGKAEGANRALCQSCGLAYYCSFA